LEELIASIFRVEKSASEEHRFTQDLHCTTSQKMAFFIVTAVKTSKLIQHIIFCFLCLLNINGVVFGLWYFTRRLRENVKYVLPQSIQKVGYSWFGFRFLVEETRDLFFFTEPRLGLEPTHATI
jgi:hypothetical protein